MAICASLLESAELFRDGYCSVKGGLAPDLARRLHSFLEVSANVPVLPARSWNSSEAAAEELFRFVLAHLSCLSSMTYTGMPYEG